MSFPTDIPPNLDWKPMAPGGSNIGTHRLVQASMNRLEFRATRAVFLFGLLFLLVGLAIVGLGVAKILGMIEGNDSATLPIVIGAIFALVGGMAVWGATLPRVFDKQVGAYWAGKRKEEEMMTGQQAGATPLGNIAGIQILSELVRGSKGRTFYSWELNLVLKDGQRVHVVDHGDPEQLKKDARTLADFLGVPIWMRPEDEANDEEDEEIDADDSDGEVG